MNLVILKNSELLTTSLIVSEQLNRTHKGIIQLIREYEKDFFDFGTLTFEMRKSKGRPTEFVYLNEQHLTFLIMILRVKKKSEKDEVLEFKKRITKEFFILRKQLLQASVNKQNEEWLKSRCKGKEARKEFTDILKKLLEFTKENDPKSTYVKRPNLLYSNFTRMIYKNLYDIEIKTKNLRDTMTEKQLSILGVAELAALKSIQENLDKNKDAKEIYKITNDKIKNYAEIVGKSKIIDLLISNQMSFNMLEDKRA